MAAKIRTGPYTLNPGAVEYEPPLLQTEDDNP